MQNIVMFLASMKTTLMVDLTVYLLLDIHLLTIYIHLYVHTVYSGTLAVMHVITATQYTLVVGHYYIYTLQMYYGYGYILWLSYATPLSYNKSHILWLYIHGFMVAWGMSSFGGVCLWWITWLFWPAIIKHSSITWISFILACWDRAILQVMTIWLLEYGSDLLSCFLLLVNYKVLMSVFMWRFFPGWLGIVLKVYPANVSWSWLMWHILLLWLQTLLCNSKFLNIFITTTHLWGAYVASVIVAQCNFPMLCSSFCM